MSTEPRLGSNRCPSCGKPSLASAKCHECSLAVSEGSAPTTFDALCEDLKVTPEEREVLVHYLAGLRYRKTLKLIDQPITRAAKAAAEFAKEGKVSVVRGKHLLRVKPNK